MTYVILVVVAGMSAVIYFLRTKNIHIWIAGYLRSLFRTGSSKQPVHIMFCFVDHYEPRWHKATLEQERDRVDKWVELYPKLVSSHKDADGAHPKHTFFYPEEEYREEHIDKLMSLCRQGYGEIEIHLHHDADTSAGFREKIARFRDLLVNKHGCLSTDKRTGETTFSFIHGDWALDNSHPDGSNCGVNDELIILREEGCYADFTLPSAPHPAQTRTINSIYMATDDPGKPKSHDTGVRLSTKYKAGGDLLIIQGPLTLNWSDRKWGLLPRIENSDIRKKQPPTPKRIDLWIEQNICIEGREDWIFVKIHTHGTQESDIDSLLGRPVDEMFSYLESHYNDGVNHVLHYVSAREMANIVRAAEDGLSGNPNQYRDYIYTNNIH